MVSCPSPYQGHNNTVIIYYIVSLAKFSRGMKAKDEQRQFFTICIPAYAEQNFTRESINTSLSQDRVFS